MRGAAATQPRPQLRVAKAHQMQESAAVCAHIPAEQIRAGLLTRGLTPPKRSYSAERLADFAAAQDDTDSSGSVARRLGRSG